jgi:hypothetical protein
LHNVFFFSNVKIEKKKVGEKICRIKAKTKLSVFFFFSENNNKFRGEKKKGEHFGV